MNADCPVVELHLPGATSDDIRSWAGRLAVENPIGAGDNPFTPAINLDVTDYPLMGVELTFQSERQQLLRLVLFATTPNEKEIQIMEADVIEAGGA